jgi:hypothetical protein
LCRGFDLKWLVEDLQVALTAELDFTNEAKNAEQCQLMFSHRKDVKVCAQWLLQFLFDVHFDVHIMFTHCMDVEVHSVFAKCSLNVHPVFTQCSPSESSTSPNITTSPLFDSCALIRVH